MPQAQEAPHRGVGHGAEELVKVALLIDEHGALQGLLGAQVVADDVVGKIVKHLEGEEEAGGGHDVRPVEDGLVDDLDLGPVAPRRRRRRRLGCALRQGGRLHAGQVGRDLDDLVPRALVHLRIDVADVVEDVEHEGAAAGTHLVDNEVVVGEGGLAVVLTQIPRYGLAVVGAEQLRGRVPELPRVGGLAAAADGAVVEGVLELAVALAEEGVEFELVADGAEVKGLARGEDDDLFGEVTVVGVV